MTEWIDSITPDQFAKLPIECQDVVNLERELHNMRQLPIVPLAKFKATRDELRRCQKLVEENWGNRQKGSEEQ